MLLEAGGRNAYFCDGIHAVAYAGGDSGHYKPISPIALWWSATL